MSSVDTKRKQQLHAWKRRLHDIVNQEAKVVPVEKGFSLILPESLVRLAWDAQLRRLVQEMFAEQGLNANVAVIKARAMGILREDLDKIMVRMGIINNLPSEKADIPREQSS